MLIQYSVQVCSCTHPVSFSLHPSPGALQTSASLCLPRCWAQKCTPSRQQCGGVCHTAWQNETGSGNAGRVGQHQACRIPIWALSLCRSTLCSQARHWSQTRHHRGLVPGRNPRQGHTKNHRTTWMSDCKVQSLVSSVLCSLAATTHFLHFLLFLYQLSYL